MKRWRGLALAACLLLSGCGAEDTVAEKGPVQEPVQVEQTHQPTVETIPPVEELAVTPDYTGWQAAYAAFLEEKAEQVVHLRTFDRPDYDPGTVQSEIDAVSGSYVLYDIDKDGTPELLFRCQFGWYTEFYGYRDGQAALLGGVHSKDAAFYSWPGENAVAYNWGRMGGHFVDKISLVDGALVQETYFEEDHFEEPEREYTPMADIVPGSSYLWEARSMVELPQSGALTLPLYNYGAERTARPLDPERDEAAKTAIGAVLNSKREFYGVTADGFGGDTGWITMEEYLQPGGVTVYTEGPLEITAQAWEDFDGDGQSEALVTLRHPEGDPYGGTMQVVFSWQDGVVYAYCLNYTDSYDVEGVVFVSKYGDASFSVAFDGYQCYQYTVE